MAQKRMFSLFVTDTDMFMDMPTSSQALYFHLGMHGDDDGFVGSPKKILRAAGCCDDDLRILVSKGYIIPFESGVVVIRDWNTNNTLKNDRYHPTLYTRERELLTEENGQYILAGSNVVPRWFQNGSDLEPEPNVTKPNVTEPNLESGADKPPSRSRFTPPSVAEVTVYCQENGYTAVDPSRFVDFYTSKGWKVGSSPMKDWKAAVRNWARRDKGENSPEKPDVPQEDLWTL
jgi:hypothetical protein